MGYRALRSAFRPIPHVPHKMAAWNSSQSPDSVLDSDHLRDQDSQPGSSSSCLVIQHLNSAPNSSPAPAAPAAAAPASPPGDIDPALCASVSSASSAHPAAGPPTDLLGLDDVFFSQEANYPLPDEDCPQHGAAAAHAAPARASGGTTHAPALQPPAHPRSSAVPFSRGRPLRATSPLAAAAAAGPPSTPPLLDTPAHAANVRVASWCDSHFGSYSEGELLFNDDTVPTWLDPTTPTLSSPTTSDPIPARPHHAPPPTHSPPPPAVPMRRAPAPTSRPIAINGARAAAPPMGPSLPPSPSATDSYSSVHCYFNLSTPVPPPATTASTSTQPSSTTSPRPPPGLLSRTFATAPLTAPPPAATSSPTPPPAATPAGPLPTSPIPIPRPTARHAPPNLNVYRLGPAWANSPATPDAITRPTATSQPAPTHPAPSSPPSPQARLEIARCRAAFNAATLATLAGPARPPTPLRPPTTPARSAAGGRPATHPPHGSQAVLPCALAAAAPSSQTTPAARPAAAQHRLACLPPASHPTTTTSAAPSTTAAPLIPQDSQQCGTPEDDFELFFCESGDWDLP